MYPPILSEIEYDQRHDELQRRLAHRSPGPTRSRPGWRLHLAARLVGIALWLDPRATRLVASRRRAAVR